MSVWQQLCKQIESQQYRNEAQYEEDFIKWLIAIFNWLPNNIRRQVPVYMGREIKRADIVLYDNKNRANIVIEMKHPKTPLGIDEEGQLHSYMRFLNVKLGFLIGNRIRVYYDEQLDGIMPILIINIPFNGDNELGAQLVRLLQNFSVSDSEELCLELAKTAPREFISSASPRPYLVASNHYRDHHRNFWQFFAQYLNGYSADSSWIEWVMNHTNNGDNKLLIPFIKKAYHSNVFLHPIIANSYVRAGIVIDLFTIKNSSKEATKAVFAWLFDRRDEIEKAMGEKLTWEIKDQNAQSIYAYNNSLTKEEINWKDTSAFLAEQLERFSRVFKPMIEEYYAQME